MMSRNFLPRAGSRWRATARAISMVALWIMVVHVIANAVGRYLFTHPFEGTLEYTAFWYLPFMVFLGVYLAASDGSHIRADLLFSRFPRRVQIESHLFGELLMVALFIGFAWYGLREALDLASIKATAGTSTVPMWPVTFLVPLVCVLSVIEILGGIVEVLRTGNPNALAQHAEAETGADLSHDSPGNERI